MGISLHGCPTINFFTKRHVSQNWFIIYELKRNRPWHRKSLVVRIGLSAFHWTWHLQSICALIIGFTTTDENIRKPTSPLPSQNIPHLPSSRQTMTAEAISVEWVFKIAGSNPSCGICHHLSFDTAVETPSCLVQQFVWEGSMWTRGLLRMFTTKHN